MKYKTSLSAIAIAAAAFAGTAQAQGLNLGAGLNSTLAANLGLSSAGTSLDVASNVGAAIDSSIGSALAVNADAGVATAVGVNLPSVASVLGRLRGNGEIQAAVNATTDVVANATTEASSESGANAGLGIRGSLESVLSTAVSSASDVNSETTVVADAVGNVQSHGLLQNLRSSLGIGAALEAVTNVSPGSGAAMSNRIFTGVVSAADLGLSPMEISSQFEAAAAVESGIEAAGNAVNAEAAASAAAAQQLSVVPSM